MAGTACFQICRNQRSKQHTFILMTGTNESWTADRSCTCGCSCTHKQALGGTAEEVQSAAVMLLNAALTLSFCSRHSGWLPKK